MVGLMKTPKPIVEFRIYKLTKGAPEEWDGPYATEEKAQADFDVEYDNVSGSQDFAIARVTVEFLPPPPPPKILKKAKR